MIIMPDSNPSNAPVRTAFLTPSFEEGRARMLGIPSTGPLEIIPWEEHWDPFKTLRDSGLFRHLSSPPKLMVDEELRDFISRGLASAGFETRGLSSEVELVRQIKSDAEVEILRAVNTGTVAAVRAMRPCLKPGLAENQVRDILDAALQSIGFTKFFNIVLFDENAALPHGGFATGGKKLAHETMVLVDVGAHYLGYSSDICRSFFIDPPRSSGFTAILSNLVSTVWPRGRPQSATNQRTREEKTKVWDVVLDAQTAASLEFVPNSTAASVDIAARNVIERAGYGKAFTHRVGHGIGIKGRRIPLHLLR